MSEAKGWLSLKIQDRPESRKNFQQALLLISIPKKIVHLATQRNRIKRLIREAFMREGRLDPGKVYLFRAAQDPGDLGLKEVQGAMKELIS